MENIVLETVLVICAASNGKLKVFLERKQEDPYKGYWILPNSTLQNNETLETSAENLYQKTTNLSSMKLFQSYTFSNLDRNPNQRTIAQSFVIITDEKTVSIKTLENASEMHWFDTEELPKLGYDHENIINKVISEVKKRIINNYDNILVDFFPNDFTLPELQRFCETIYNKKIDRRNFHKKFVSQELVIDTGIKTVGGSGRPGLLYRFNKENMHGKKI